MTTIFGTVCYPIDTVKRQMMIQEVPQSFPETSVLNPKQEINTTHHPPAATQMRSARSVGAFILRSEGVKGFYRGLSANLMRGVGGAALLVTYDEMKVFVHSLFDDNSREL